MQSRRVSTVLDVGTDFLRLPVLEGGRGSVLSHCGERTQGRWLGPVATLYLCGTVHGVKVRALVLLVVVTSLVAAVFLVGRFADNPDPVRSPLVVDGPVDQRTAEAELRALETINVARFRSADARSKRGRVLQATTRSPDPRAVRVLVIGDSYTFGFGNLDPDVRWWRLLEEELNRRTEPGRFDVVAVAEQGASTMEQARWLDSGLIEDVNPDVIVLGYVSNDPVASPVDLQPGGLCGSSVCRPRMVEQAPEFRTCLDRGDMSVPECQEEVRAQFPHLAVETAVVADPTSSPYFLEFAQAARQIVSLAGSRPVLWAPLSTSRDEVAANRQVRDVFENAGYRLVDMERSQELLLSQFGRQSDTDPAGHPGMAVHPGDPGHPGPLLTYAFARDTADALLRVVDVDALDTTVDLPRQDRPLVTSVLPLDSTVAATGAGATVQVPAGAWAPCTELGRPHLYLTLDRTSIQGTGLLLSSPQEQQWDVYAAGYGANGEPVAAGAGVIGGGSTVRVTLSPESTRLMLAPVGTSGCPESGQWTVPELTLDLSAL